MIRAAVLALVATVVVGCGATPGPQAPRPRDHAVVIVKSNVRDAQLYVDGRFVGPLDAIHGVAIAPGTHRLEIRRDDYFSRYLEVTLARSERRKIAVDLAPVLP